MKLISTLAIAAAIATTGCNVCGPEQHAITTSSAGLSLGGDVQTRTVQYVTQRLTEPPASHSVFQFAFNALEGSANGEGVALSFSGTDAITQEVVTVVLALPVALRQGDEYTVGSTFSVDPGSPTQAGFWGAHDLAQSNQADVAFVVAKYDFPPPTYTPNFRAVSSAGTIRVADRTQGHVQLSLDLSFTDAAGNVRTLTGEAYADTEKTAALCT
jgi:hypothetical protein